MQGCGQCHIAEGSKITCPSCDTQTVQRLVECNTARPAMRVQLRPCTTRLVHALPTEAGVNQAHGDIFSVKVGHAGHNVC